MSPRAGYAVFTLSALAVFLLARRLTPRPPALAAEPPWKRAALALAAFVGGALGAKLPFALADPAGWWSPAAWLADGKTITTGLMGGYLAVELTKAALGVRVKTGDTFALPLALALAVGRLGCFWNGCCYGRATGLPWAVSFEVGGRLLPCHPTQLYEAAFHLTAAFVLAWLTARGLLPTRRLAAYLIAYAAFRFLTEWVRPEPVWLLGLTFYQWAALALAAGLAAQWAWEAWAVGPGEERRFSGAEAREGL
jgi:phosphatidylglycerol:prolipoprotein diacylglycerol transferase